MNDKRPTQRNPSTTWPLKEHELIEGLDRYGAHADELPVLLPSEWCELERSEENGAR